MTSKPKPDWAQGCTLIESRYVSPGWGCCACAKRTGSGVYNSASRDKCKVCGHEKCGKAK